MRLNVRDILAEEMGYSRSFAIQDEEPQFENVTLTRPIDGDISVAKLERNLMVRGWIETEVRLECHRCLEPYEKPMNLRLEQVYSEAPGDDQMPIERDEIDLAPLIEQELILAQPIKLICRDDCVGVPGAQGYLSGGTDSDSATPHNNHKEG